MKNKIKRLANGDFHIVQPDVLFPETRIIMRVGEGEVYHGSFALQSQNENTIRGLVYPSSYRVKCEEQGFEGKSININFTYDGSGLIPGHVEHGKFTIVCNGGEYDIAFAAIIEKPFVMTAHGKVQSLEDFKKLAFKDFAEAEKLFRSRDFYEILKYEDKRIRALYDNMRRWELDSGALEEFLVGCKQKEKIFMTLEDESRAFTNFEESRKETLIIRKNTWGYQEINVRTEGDFLKVYHTKISTDEFIGNTCRLEYFVEDIGLHRGSNFGQIILETPYETLSYEVVVEKDIKRDEDRRLVDIEVARLLKTFLTFQSGRITMDEWSREALKSMEYVRRIDDDNEYYRLIQAHVYLLGGHKDEAKWLLESYNYNRFSIGKDVELSSYYLYLTTCLTKDSVGQKRVAEELSKTYMKHPDSWKILCMLIQVDQEYRLNSEKLRVLEEQFYRGAHSLLFYYQAFRCYKEKSTALKRLGTFEVQVLLFAVKYKLMTKELALYTANLASQLKGFDRQLYKVLAEAYKMYEEPMILNAICTQLIKGNCIASEYFKWYEKAVESEMKIAQLYEYYMASIQSVHFKKELPRTVYLYFMHGNNLNERKCAMLYANVITYEDESSEIYAHYREEMAAFAWEQLEQRHVDEQLRIIYKRFIVEDELTPDRVRALYDICHAYEVTTSHKRMKLVHVIGEDGNLTQRVPYLDNGAQVFLYTKVDRIVWEGKDGRHYMDTIPYESKRLFYELRYLDMCKKYLSGITHREPVEEEPEMTLEYVAEAGVEKFQPEDLFALCNRTIRETNYAVNDLLTYLCYELFTKGVFDKISLTYLAKYYCGATREMKRLWKEAKEYEVHTHELSERILTQMLFSEALLNEEAIFEDYYGEGAYFRLQQAYLVYVSREYVVFGRKMHRNIIDIICQEYEKGEDTVDICKIAVLKYYASRPYQESLRKTLKKFLQELCGAQIYFPFFMKYDEEWLMELQLWDKTLIEYRGQSGSRVMLYYQLQADTEKPLDYSTEVLTPMYENIYVKKFVLYGNERLKFYFKETVGQNTYRSEKELFIQELDKGLDGRYGRINDMIMAAEEKKPEKIRQYAEEEEIANRVFGQY